MLVSNSANREANVSLPHQWDLGLTLTSEATLTFATLLRSELSFVGICFYTPKASHFWKQCSSTSCTLSSQMIYLVNTYSFFLLQQGLP